MKIFLTCFLAVALNACVVTYDFPKQEGITEVQAPSLEYYHARKYQSSVMEQFPFYYVTAPTDATYAKLERIIVDKGIPAISTDSPPTQGSYFTVTAFRTHPSAAAQISGIFSLVSLLFLPAFGGTGGYLMTYDLYVDGTFQKTYHYEIGRKGVAWMVLLPFIWVNALTASEEDAFQATTTQFLLDVERDYPSNRRRRETDNHSTS